MLMYLKNVQIIFLLQRNRSEKSRVNENVQCVYAECNESRDELLGDKGQGLCHAVPTATTVITKVVALPSLL